MIHKIIERILDSSDVTDIVGTRVFPLIASQNSELPSVVVQMVSLRTNDTKEASSPLHVYTIHVTSFANEPSQCWTLSKACQAQLNNWTPTDNVVRQSRLIDMASDVFESTEVFSFTQEFEVFCEI